jgi:hypothetical protein
MYREVVQNSLVVKGENDDTQAFALRNTWPQRIKRRLYAHVLEIGPERHSTKVVTH